MNLENTYDLLLINGEVLNISLLELFKKNNKTILYFYPKDNTPGCTIENKDFSSLKEKFLELGINLIGVSKDSIESHKKFIEKQGLKNDLLSDIDLVLHKELGVYGEKMNYGKKVMGVIRSTFLIDNEGNILKEYRNIRAKGHAERILKELKG